MLARGERLDSLVEKSSDLSISSQVGIFLLCVYVVQRHTTSYGLWAIGQNDSCVQLQPLVLTTD